MLCKGVSVVKWRLSDDVLFVHKIFSWFLDHIFEVITVYVTVRLAATWHNNK